MIGYTYIDSASGHFILKLNSQGDVIYVKAWKKIPPAIDENSSFRTIFYKDGNIYCTVHYKLGATKFKVGLMVFDTAFHSNCMTADTIVNLNDTAEFQHRYLLNKYTTFAYSPTTIMASTTTLSSSGTTDLCSLVSVNSPQPLKQSFTIYPNPTSGAFNIILPREFSRSAQLEIFNSIGEKAYSSILSNQQTEIKTTLPSGIYLLQIKNPQSTITKKLLIQ